MLVAAYRSSSQYFVVLNVLFSLILVLNCTLCYGSIHYPHTKMPFHRFGYLFLTFFLLGSLLMTESHACNTAGTGCNRY